MQAWTIYDNIHTLPTEDLATIIRETAVFTKKIEGFVQDKEKYFIVAPRGFGKSIFLAYKSGQFRVDEKITCLPTISLVEQIHKPSISQDLLKEYPSINSWENLWRLCLYVFIIKQTNPQELPEELTSIIAEAISFSDIFQILYHKTPELANLYTLIPKFLSPRMEQLEKPIALFIDGLDDAFEDFETQHTKTWINIQLGLIRSILKLNKKSSQIKIYASIRSEVFAEDNSSTALQDELYATIVQYTKEDLEKLFIRHIGLLNPSQLSNPETESVIEQFLNCDTITHYAEDHATEPVFDFIYRHTFGRPVEIMKMGAALQSIAPRKRNAATVKQKIIETSQLLLNNYKREIHPALDKDAYLYFCRNVSSSVLSKKELDIIQNKVQAYTGESDFLENYFRRGLIGWVQPPRENEAPIQYFLPINGFIKNKDRDIPSYVNYFLIHPTILADIVAQLPPKETFENQYLIGTNLPFHPTPSIKARELYAKGMEAATQLKKDNYQSLGGLKKTIEDLEVCLSIYGEVSPTSNQVQQIRTTLIDLYNVTTNVDSTNIEAWKRLLELYKEQDEQNHIQRTSKKIYELQQEKHFLHNVASPFKLENIQLEDIHFFKNIDWEVQPQINILLGKNGYGKTFLLRIILTLLQYNIQLSRSLLKSNNKKADAKITIRRLKNQEQELIHHQNNIFQTTTGKLPILAISDIRFIERSNNYLGAPSTEEWSDLSRHGAYFFMKELAEEERIRQLLAQTGIAYFKSNKDLYEFEQIQILKRVITFLTNSPFEFSRIEYDQSTGNIQIYVTTEANPNDPVLIQKISRGTISVLSIFGLIYNFLKTLTPTSKEVCQQSGVVIIDEIDAHLHPDWQQKIVPLLIDIFPEVQFILTAHSPRIVAGCLEKEVCVLEKREDGYFTVRQIKEDFVGEYATSIYASVFGIREEDYSYNYFRSCLGNLPKQKSTLLAFQNSSLLLAPRFGLLSNKNTYLEKVKQSLINPTMEQLKQMNSYLQGLLRRNDIGA